MIIYESDLDLDGDVCIYQGKPFTGVARAYHPNGMLKMESAYCGGFEQGLCKDWYSNGQLKREWFAVRGVADGKMCEWHENGHAKIVANYIKGIELEFDEWNPDGLQITHRTLDPQSELWRYVKELYS